MAERVVLSSYRISSSARAPQLAGEIRRYRIVRRKRGKRGRSETERLRLIIDTQRFINAAGLDASQVMRVVAERAEAMSRAAAAIVELVDGDEMIYRTAVGTAAPWVGTRLKVAGSLSGLCVR